MRKPPMSLQYAIWATAAAGHAKYDQYAEIFYKRARHYMEADEMRASFHNAMSCQLYGFLSRTLEPRAMEFFFFLSSIFFFFFFSSASYFSNMVPIR